NIMVDRQGHLHLMDFGLAARAEEGGEAKLTNDGAVMGTPAYMAPEQAAGQRGEARPAADQYAAGVVLYELLSGPTPFDAPPAVPGLTAAVFAALAVGSVASSAFAIQAGAQAIRARAAEADADRRAAEAEAARGREAKAVEELKGALATAEARRTEAVAANAE